MGASWRPTLKTAGRLLRRLVPFPRRKTLRKWFPHLEERNTVHLFNACGVTHIVDVGANSGQFAIRMRSAGFRGRITSFEPVSHVHEQLTNNARRDPLWTVAPRVALGGARGEATIHVMSDSALSSLLTMKDNAPVRAERVEVTTLDDALAQLDIANSEALALKIDVQGFEMDVLRGAEQALRRARALLIELCLTPTYHGETDYLAILHWLAQRGFRAAAFSQVVTRPRLGKMYQVDVLLIRSDEPAPVSAAQ